MTPLAVAAVVALVAAVYVPLVLYVTSRPSTEEARLASRVWREPHGRAVARSVVRAYDVRP